MPVQLTLNILTGETTLQPDGSTNVVAVIAPPSDYQPGAQSEAGCVWRWWQQAANCPDCWGIEGEFPPPTVTLKVLLADINDYATYESNSGAPGSTSVPTMVPTISNVVAIAGGDGFTLAVTSNGYVYGWGNNGSGQLGVYTGTLSQTSSPMLIAGISNAVLVSAPPQQSGRHCLAVTIAGGTNQYWAWGNSYYGQVGNGVTNQSFSYPCGPDICTSNNDSNVYAPAGPLQFPISYATCVQLGTSGSFTAPFTGTLTLYFNDNIYGDNTNGYTVTIEPFGQTYVPGTNAQGVAIGTVSNGVAYTYTASGWVNINNPHDPNDDADPNGNGHSQQPLGCRSEDPCTFTCPSCTCYSLVGKITSP
jgi:hypothetical protein